MVASRPGMRLRRCARRTGFEILNHTRRENKMAPEGAILFSGGEGGIRTHEGLLTLAGFQDRCIQPLCHLSEARKDTRNAVRAPALTSGT